MRWRFTFLLIMSSVLAGGQGLTFRHVTIADGLNNGTINAIEQDSLGRLWLATWDGLMHYDGYSVVNYKPVLGDEHSLPSKKCAQLSLDSRNNLWVSTISGLCRYDPAFDRFVRYRMKGLPPTNPVRAKLTEHKGKLLITMGGEGQVFYLPSEKLDSIEFNPMSIFGAENLISDRYVRFLFANEEKVLLCFRDRDEQGQWITQVFNGRILNDSIIRIDDQYEFQVAGNVREMVADGSRIYIGSDAGFAVYDYETDQLTEKQDFKNFKIKSIVLGSDGNIWLGTDQNGLIRYHPISEELERFKHDPNRINTLLGNNIFTLFEDFSGNLLVGHGGEGITILNLKDKQFHTYRYDPQDPGSIGDNTVFCFSEFQNGMLVGTRYRGLFHMHLDPLTGKTVFKQIEFPREFMEDVDLPIVWCIEKEKEDTYWIGTVFGLFKAVFADEQWKFSRFFEDHRFRAIFIDDDQNMWLGSYTGFIVVPSARRESMEGIFMTHQEDDPYSISDRVVTSFLLDGNNNLWLGTENGGMNKLLGPYGDLDFTTRLKDQIRFKRYGASLQENALNNEEINALYEHPDGSIWIGTKGGGINILDPSTDGFRALTTEHGLPGNNVYGILPDNQGRLWFSTNRGLSSYDLISAVFTNYTPSDGIQGNVFMNNSSYRAESGEMFFGGRNGFTRFFPDKILNNEVLPLFHFSGIEVMGRRIDIGDTIHKQVILPRSLYGLPSVSLSFRERSFRVLFSAIHFQFPGDNLVEYYLDGFDDHRTVLDASTGRFTFNNLNNGQYILNVRAGNSDNIWSQEFSSLEINILPPWYKTRWALSLFLLVAIVVVTGLIRLLLHRQSLAHELRIEKIEKRNLRELNESKLRFFTNISHEFRTPLSLTVGPIDNLLREKQNGDFRLRKQLAMASRNAKLLLRLVDQIIDFRRLEAGKIRLKAMELDMNLFLQSIIENFEPIRKEKDVCLFVNYPEEPLLLWIDPRKMEQVLYNLLSNAFKHVPKEGSIAVTLNRTDHKPGEQGKGSWAQISVYNDGKTIPEEDLSKIFERFYKVDENQLGSGIGLAYARSLVDLHMGDINVENKLDSGVAFNIYLPRGKHHLKQEDFAGDDQVYTLTGLELKGPDNDLPCFQRSTEKHELSLLVVEDNDELREFFRTILAERYDFHEAANGLSGYELAEKVIPDIIITDLLMPEMNGFELCEKLKSNEKTSHIPIILLTAKNTPEDQVTGYKSGADAYVVKPFEISVLEAQISRLIENRSRLQERYSLEGKGEAETPEVLTREDHFINRVKELIEKDLEDPDLNVNKLSEKINLSSTQLYRKIKAVTGQSSVDFIKDYRLIRSATLLRSTDHSVKEVCFLTGFKSPSYFVKCFKVKYGLTPREFASNGSGSTIKT